MSTLVITISIDVPSTAAVTVGSGGSSGLSPAVPSTAPQSHAAPDEPPWPDMTPAALEAFPDALVTNPESVLHDQTHVEIPVAPPGGHHNQPWRYVPPGVSKRTGASYPGFWACAGDKTCKAKP